MKKTDVFVISGFLGSGKSTLLKNLILFEQGRGRRIGVIMNELGSISIDSVLVPSEIPLKELLNGCICCTLQGELSLQMKNLLKEHPLDVIYIEATGAAHPLEIIDACTHPEIATCINIKAVITVVNALQWYEDKMNNKMKKLLIEQIKFADIILLNKIDKLKDNNVLALLLDRMNEFNLKAKKFPVSYTNIDPDILNSTVGIDQKDQQRILRHVHDHLHLRTVNLSLDGPVDRIKLIEWLNNISGTLYRAKGFISLTETPGLYLVNFAYDDLIIEKSHLKQADNPILVLIGENLDSNKLKEQIGLLY